MTSLPLDGDPTCDKYFRYILFNLLVNLRIYTSINPLTLGDYYEAG